MDYENDLEERSLISHNSSNFYTERKMIDTVIERLAHKTVINRDNIVKTISYIQIPTRLSQKHDYSPELEKIVNGFRGILELQDDGSIWIKLKRPQYVIPYGVWGGVYLLGFLFYVFYYSTGASRLFFSYIEYNLL